MIELRETDTARAMLRQTPVFQRLRQDDPDKLLRLERLCNQTYFDIRSGAHDPRYHTRREPTWSAGNLLEVPAVSKQQGSSTY